MSLLVLGALHLDVIVKAERLPRLDETLTGRSVSYRMGGKGANQAVAAARMGASVAMAGAVGSDAFAETLIAGLAAAGVDHSQITRHPGASGMSVAIEDARGDYGAVIVSGANLGVTGAEIPPGTTHLLLQNEVPEAANLAAARAARARGARVILNAAPARPMAAELLALTDLLVVNRVEAAALAGADPARLLALGPTEVIVTRGADGLLHASANATRTLPALKVDVISTHGAGDAFVGALAARLDAGRTLPEALAFAQAAAALHVATPPDRRGDITRAAVERLLG